MVIELVIPYTYVIPKGGESVSE